MRAPTPRRLAQFSSPDTSNHTPARTHVCMATSLRVIPVVIPLRYDCVVAQKVGPKGQVVIPKKFRDELGIEPGDEVEVSLSENGVLIQSVHTTKTLRGIFSDSGMLEMLISDRSKESR
ncbi:MAG: hypothetical protein RJA79_1074 [Actinomycetota bacterium]